MNKQQIALLRQIAQAILEAVKAADINIGAPGGVLYAAMMINSCSLNQFEQIMDGMVRAGWLTKSGDCYHVGPDADRLAA